jgi:hypothetical protein
MFDKKRFQRVNAMAIMYKLSQHVYSPEHPVVNTSQQNINWKKFGQVYDKDGDVPYLRIGFSFVPEHKKIVRDFVEEFGFKEKYEKNSIPARETDEYVFVGMGEVFICGDYIEFKELSYDYDMCPSIVHFLEVHKQVMKVLGRDKKMAVETKDGRSEFLTIEEIEARKKE